MANPNRIPRSLIEGKPVVIVIDIQCGAFNDQSTAGRNIDHMAGYTDRLGMARHVIGKARECGIPVIFIQEIHRADGIDFGRELDGEEAAHCLDSNPNTAIAKDQLGFQEGDYVIQKRRYSAFYGTDLEILLRGLKAETLLLMGGLTNVCVHYTFADAHQGDYFCRTVEDCTAASSLEAHQAALKQMEYLQTGSVVNLASALQAMEDYAARLSAG